MQYSQLLRIIHLIRASTLIGGLVPTSCTCPLFPQQLFSNLFLRVPYKYSGHQCVMCDVTAVICNMHSTHHCISMGCYIGIGLGLVICNMHSTHGVQNILNLELPSEIIFVVQYFMSSAYEELLDNIVRENFCD